MTKQEKIREGVGIILYRVWKDGNDGDIKTIRTGELLQYLHSQGVVIKVREAILSKGVYNKGSFTLKRETVCTAVEPLIEVK